MTTTLPTPKFEMVAISSSDDFALAFPVLHQLAVLEIPDEAEDMKLPIAWKHYQSAMEQGFTLYMAKNSNEVLGVAGLRIMYDPFTTGKPYGQINDLVVEEDYRGLGIGREMLTQLEKIAKKAGCGSVILAILKTNKKGKKFYENSGFDSPIADVMLKGI